MNFFNIPIINVALAIIISWALFAIFCGLIIEAFAQIKAERGRFMKNYLLQQLNDIPNGINWASLLYLHGNIDLLCREIGKPTSDINPRLFSETIVDVVANSQIVKMQTEVKNDFKNETLSNFKKATQALQPSDVMNLFTQAIKSAELQGLSGGVIDESVVYKKLVENIETWYSEMTQRLSLWYKKKTRKSLFLVGVVLALVLNVDSIQLFQVYNNDTQTRDAVISYYEKNANSFQMDSAHQSKELKALIKSIDSIKNHTLLPVGYDNSAINLVIMSETSKTRSLGFWIWKILGIIISGFAASFGGPFWFDTLKKIYSKKI